MNYVNAGIKSKKEARERLDAGEVFYHSPGDEGRIFVDYNQEGSPYRFDAGDRNYALHGLWDYCGEWLKKAEWWDSIPEHGMLCWVSEVQPEPGPLNDMANILQHCARETYKFQGKAFTCKYATPLTDEEIKKFLRGYSR